MVLGIDLGGTKLATALFSEAGEMVSKSVTPLEHRGGEAVGRLVADAVSTNRVYKNSRIRSVGISVPGIARSASGTVWAPNIPGWEDYPLVSEIKDVVKDIPVNIDSDRACCMLGELWQGSARGCRDAIFLAVGTGIGAGILAGGSILRGSHDVAGSVGWLALDKPFLEKYVPCGCFEYYASGDGIARFTQALLDKDATYTGMLREHADGSLTSRIVFTAHERGDPLAARVLTECVQYWGMAAANLISIFNPEKIIFGGGVFGPALKLLDSIREEAAKWAQPVSMKQVRFEASGLSGDAAIFGAGYLALNNLSDY